MMKSLMKLAVLVLSLVVLWRPGGVYAAARGLSGPRMLAQNGTDSEEMPDRWTKLKREDGPSARAFCASTSFQGLKCGFASMAEVEATSKEQCPLCGTLYRSLFEPDEAPFELEGVDRYNQYLVGIISLACRGPVVVRSVFKMLEETPMTQEKIRLRGWEGPNCTNSLLLPVDNEPPASPVIRCELELPSTGGSEVERALKAREVRCWTCGWCNAGKGCPSAVGKWYSDSFTTQATGCDFTDQKGYMAHRSGININPHTRILLAKYEVCNSPGCFDPVAEKAKQEAAAPCVKGKCA